MQKLTPMLWSDREAEEAAELERAFKGELAGQRSK